jgi:[acyl-carrier-protein] S-malonyltransferase
MQSVFVFPGQGSQSVGMMAELADRDRIVTDTFAEASTALGFDLWQLTRDGPAGQLNETVNTQPVMLAADVATWRYWQRQGGYQPDVVCGHSLGEFAALVAAGSLGLADASRLVRARAELMQAAVPEGVGAIAAVLGLEDGEVAAACREAAHGEIVESVNFNVTGQVVIAGHAGAVQRALDECTRRGAKRAVMLPMSVPAHSSLMQPAADGFAKVIEAAPLTRPAIPFWSPVDCRQHDEVGDIRKLLVRQLASPVCWKELVRTLTAAGAFVFVECGPGKVLTGLNRRIERRRNLLCHALEDPDAVHEALHALTAVSEISTGS